MFGGWYYDRALTKVADFTAPQYDDKELFELLILEMFQSGDDRRLDGALYLHCLRQVV